ncbi:MAG: 4Fe-4S cluster-binding domain-containing protein, partial [Thermodesulfobacteriota bacterium]|nr:4Fe-4S cluster-binding domain-containing protein [Thermodesulfobacteriota bacterium]
MLNRADKIFPEKYKLYSRKNIDQIPQLENLPEDFLVGIKTVSTVLPFRVNNYVVEQLIDWNNIPDDPIFQLTFPQPEMLDKQDFEKMNGLLMKKASEKDILTAARKIQMSMNPNPAGQMDLNVPKENGKTIRGMQHKYHETVLFFPSQGQTCHAYCTYCFRWAQFIGLESIRFASSNTDVLIDYLKNHPEVTDVLFTGGDPLFMQAKILRRYIEPLIKERPGNLATIRIGTKVPAYWPYRFLTDNDADELMRLFEEVVASGVHLSIMSHFSHHREIETPVAQAAVKRILNTGAVVRCQAPIVRHINDNHAIWARMWQAQVKIGAIPYYMFVERDTGPKNYFEIPLERTYRIFTKAYKKVSGLCRTVRGPSMSATPGKVMIDGITEINGEKVFALKFIQARNPNWTNQIFFARYNKEACWLDDL